VTTLRPCYLSNLLIEERGDQQVIFLSERDGTRRIPIVVGPFEASAIDRALKATRFPRPLTHDLFVNLLAATDHEIREIRIVDLREGTFYAELLIIGQDEQEILLDCRPSDAVALMVRLPDVKLLVAEDVLAEAGS
jgi:uncharacterized protein